MRSINLLRTVFTVKLRLRFFVGTVAFDPVHLRCCSVKKDIPKRYVFLLYGGDGRDRTVDLLNAIQALSQLSYAPEAVLY